MSFDAESWSATYRSFSADVQPTSDSPLYWFALVFGADRLGLAVGDKPLAALHGHTLPDAHTLAALNIPVSDRECVFSTREDAESMLALLVSHPYPEHEVFVRKGHGERRVEGVWVMAFCVFASALSGVAWLVVTRGLRASWASQFSISRIFSKFSD